MAMARDGWMDEDRGKGTIGAHRIESIPSDGSYAKAPLMAGIAMGWIGCLRLVCRSLCAR